MPNSLLILLWFLVTDCAGLQTLCQYCSHVTCTVPRYPPPTNHHISKELVQLVWNGIKDLVKFHLSAIKSWMHLPPGQLPVIHDPNHASLS